GATNYAWQFGDAQASTSTLTNPSFTYTSLGEYTAALTAFNTLGCSTTSSTVIRVVIPAIDLVMSDFYLSKDAQTGILQPVVTITNNSNVTVTDPIVVIDIAGGARVQKQLVGSIKPTKDFTQVLDFQLLPQAITYVCAEVQASGDTDLFLNRKCVSVNDLEIVLTPFPNPATETLTLDWVSKTATPVSIDIFNASGNVVFQQSITSVVAGLNRLTVSVEALPAGVYFIRFSDTSITRSFRFAVTKK
ncbi:MAG: T9SS type A sorting domain-containing protein, partial [Cyclobacteriaceae bacterium]